MEIKLNASSRIMYEEAIKLGITCTLIGDMETILMEKNGRQWYTRGSRTSRQSSVGKSIADNKSLTKKVLTHFGLPTAKAVTITNETELDTLNQLAFPIVMKPLSARHGAGVVVGINDLEEAKTNYQKLQTEYSKVICEEMLQGTEYRIVCVDYSFVAAAFRKPAHVTGDGQSSIQQLIDIKNQHPWRGQGHTANLTLIEVDDSVNEYLQVQGLSLDTVLPTDREAWLRKTANLSTGGEAWDVSASVCAENAQLFEKIARACDLNVIGIDIMCESLEKPIVNQTRAGVIEVNASPGLRMHHYPIKGEAKNVARAILGMSQK